MGGTLHPDSLKRKVQNEVHPMRPGFQNRPEAENHLLRSVLSRAGTTEAEQGAFQLHRGLRDLRTTILWQQTTSNNVRRGVSGRIPTPIRTGSPTEEATWQADC